MKPILLNKKNKETLFDAAKRSCNQANLNNRIVIFQHGNFSCLVYPCDILGNVLKAIKSIILMDDISRLETALGK
jgi:hypothetical protein